MSRALLHLRRITSSGRFVPEVDGLRFVAIASVVLYHLHGFVLANRVAPDVRDSIRVVAEHGYRGVNLCYAISGFILGLPFAAHHLHGGPPVPLRPYFLRRLTRPGPPYIVNLLICFALLVLAGASSTCTTCGSDNRVRLTRSPGHLRLRCNSIASRRPWRWFFESGPGWRGGQRWPGSSFLPGSFKRSTGMAPPGLG